MMVGQTKAEVCSSCDRAVKLADSNHCSSDSGVAGRKGFFTVEMQRFRGDPQAQHLCAEIFLAAAIPFHVSRGFADFIACFSSV
jgi:hypothetical protein